MSTMAVSLNGVRPVEAMGLGAREPVARDGGQQLSRGQMAAVVTSIGLGVVVAGYGLAGSYVSVADLANSGQPP